MPTATELAIAFKKAIDRQDAATLMRLAKTYRELYTRLLPKMDSLILAMSKMEEPTTGQVHRLAQYKSLLNSVEEELAKYQAYVEIEIRAETRAAAELAIKQTNAYLANFGLAMPQRINTDAVLNMLGYLQEDSPLWKRLSLYSADNTAKLADALTEGVAFGYNPTKVAKTFERIMGGGLTDAMRMTRTSMLHTYRDASHAQFIANQDVVDGWTWWSSKDASTCLACLSQHGKVFPLTERLNGHYNCRCVAIPHVKIWSEPEQTGEEWFSTLSEAQQKEMMGAQTWQAWKDGKFELSDMATRRHDDVYGEMLARTPLQDLIGNGVTDESITQDYDTVETGKPIKDQTVYRYGDDSGKVSFYSLERDYAEEYASVRGGVASDVRKTSVNIKNPLVVNVSSINFSDPDYENPIIERAMRSKHDGIVFVSDDGYDRFFVKFNK
jgi:SPP1 gp7 family putative phage head morphogenesis protein